MGERQGDVVYTPAWAAADMVSHFRPAGRVLDPCRGKGAFTDLLPGSDWCEITDGRDFFDWHTKVDWVISNPPYSMTREWFRHSYEVADNLVYLVPLRNIFSGYGFVKEIHDFGGIVEIRMYGTGSKLGFPMGNAIGAFHIRRGYAGPTVFSFYEEASVALFDLEVEYGVYDSKYGPDPIWWYCFGLPHKTAASAKHTGDKSVWGQTVIVRRRPSQPPVWEHVTEEVADV